MARIRTVKPEIWLSPQVMNLSHAARLLFLGLITQADDEGRGSADPRRLKGAIFPGDDILAADVAKLLGECEREQLVTVYDQGRLYSLPSWRQHQSINKPKPSAYPPPVAVPGSAGTNPVAVPDDSRGIGREGNGKDRKGTDTRASQLDELRELDGIRDAYPRGSGSPDWLTGEREYRARIDEGDSLGDILAGVRRYADYCTATKAIGTQFVLAPRRFFAERKYREPWPLPVTKADQRLGANLSAAEEFMRRTEVQ